MVAGNHEMWSRKLSYEEHFEAGHAAADQHRVRLLENGVEFLGNTRVLGCTLWTDYENCGGALRAAAMRSAGESMLDHRRIKWSRDPWMRFRPAEARLLHLQSRDFLERELEKPHSGPTIVVCHHAMTLYAVAPQHRLDILSAAYASDMMSMIDRFQPDLVAPGHTHHGIDFRRGKSRLISNPAGYDGENRSFDPAKPVRPRGRCSSRRRQSAGTSILPRAAHKAAKCVIRHPDEASAMASLPRRRPACRCPRM
jgi:hypothetical protein